MPPDYTFLYPRLEKLIKQEARKQKTRYNPQQDLWAVAEERLWQQSTKPDYEWLQDFSIEPCNLRGPILRTIIRRAIIDWLRRDSRQNRKHIYIDPQGINRSTTAKKLSRGEQSEEHHE